MPLCFAGDTKINPTQKKLHIYSIIKCNLSVICSYITTLPISCLLISFVFTFDSDTYIAGCHISSVFFLPDSTTWPRQSLSATCNDVYTNTHPYIAEYHILSVFFHPDLTTLPNQSLSVVYGLKIKIQNIATVSIFLLYNFGNFYSTFDFRLTENFAITAQGLLIHKE